MLEENLYFLQSRLKMLCYYRLSRKWKSLPDLKRIEKNQDLWKAIWARKKEDTSRALHLIAFSYFSALPRSKEVY